ncbi:transmembrane protein 198-like isoform X1 [Macrosteles quadrilineatus]|uniref:transmembrane protein 198-like isoform X1 n=1 Tax=Macrosteles quadrilineatus TaxID=74068 RepID=UPI0023E222D1|nr:transmembrane protein 198-like isoform X1 [Macrosteles quadrilineatus]
MSADSLVPVDRGVESSPPPLPGAPGVVPTYPQRCHAIDYNYDLIPAVICAMYIVFGIVYSLFGYRCFKAVMFLTGFIFGSVIIYMICIQDKLLPPYANAGMALSAGLLLGLITMLVQYVGLFMTGFHTGLFVAIASLVTTEQVSHPPTLLTTAGTMLGCGVLFAVLNLQWPKAFTVLGTSVYGGAILSGALDYFIEKLMMVRWVWDRITLRQSPAQPCWFSWAVLGLWPSVVVFGLIVQFAITGRGIHHQQLLPVKHPNRHGNVPRPRTREQRAELRQKKYRYLYQVRTAHGDVISQNYVQALQRKVIGGGGGVGESSTLQSDATHLTILPDATTAHFDDDIQLDPRLHYR